jgi:ABC-2 type transport system permease protein
MEKIFTVAKREFTYNIRRPSFLFAVLGLPLIFVVVFGIIFLTAQDDNTDLNEWGKVGYVDNTPINVLGQGAAPEEYPDLFVPYESLDTARAALDEGEIAAYFELPTVYMLTGRVNLYTAGDTPGNLNDVIEEFLLVNLTAGQNLALPLDRIQEGADMTVQSAQTGREATQGGVFAMLMLPVIFAFLLVMASLTSSGFLMNGLVEERTNRVIEILVTSTTPMQLLLGKIIGLGLLGLTQVLVLLGAGYLLLSLGSGLEFLQGVEIPLDMAAMAIVYFILTYFMLAALLSAISVMANSEQESRQISSFVTIPFMIPYMLLFTFISDPNGTLPQVLSFIPFTAPMSVLIRLGLSEVPTWQILASMGIMLLTTIFLIWGAAKVFRWGLLLYGKRFSMGEIWRVVTRRNAEMGTSVATTTQEGAAS